MSGTPDTSRLMLDRAVATLAGRAEAWQRVPLAEKVALLRTMVRRCYAEAPALIAESLEARGYPPEVAGEQWVTTVVSQIRTMRILANTLDHIDRTGRAPFSSREVRVRSNGQVALQVVPDSIYDRLLYFGFEGEVWLDPEIDRADLADHLGGIHTKPHLAEPGVSLVLGAGNITAIPILDAVHKLFVDGMVVLLKYNPINDYIGSYAERVFSDLVSGGYLRAAYGGAEVGSYLVGHAGIDQIHMTGSAATHDAIVWGTGPEAQRRKERGEPLVAKPVSSELGNVSPVIVVPGEWSDRDLTYQAEDVATQMLYGSGFYCNAAKVVVLPEAWPQREAFLDRLRRVLLRFPNRRAYYPGAEERFDRFVASHDDVDLFGPRRDGYLPPALLNDVDPNADHLAFSEEAFCSVSATVSLPGEPAEYLDRAVGFCNERLTGTLNASMIIDPAARRALGDQRLGDAVERLRYGAVVINEWAAAAFVLGSTPWGAFPGHTLEDVGSGIGFVHNSRLIDRPQRSVVTVPFRRWPKPPWFVTHRSHAAALRRAAGMEADSRIWKLPGVALAALRS